MTFCMSSSMVLDLFLILPNRYLFPIADPSSWKEGANMSIKTTKTGPGDRIDPVTLANQKLLGPKICNQGLFYTLPITKGISMTFYF